MFKELEDKILDFGFKKISENYYRFFYFKLTYKIDILVLKNEHIDEYDGIIFASQIDKDICDKTFNSMIKELPLKEINILKRKEKIKKIQFEISNK